MRDPKQGRIAFEPKGKWAKGIICGCFIRTSAAFAHPIGFPEGYILAKPPDASMDSYMSQVSSCILERTFKELESPQNPPSHCQTGSKLGQGTLLQLWLEQTVTSLVVGSYLVRPSNTRSPIKTTPGKWQQFTVGCLLKPKTQPSKGHMSGVLCQKHGWPH